MAAQRIYRFLMLCLAILPAWGERAMSQKSPAITIADFSMPDTVCVGSSVPIVNLSQGASTYLWKFCTGDPLTDIRGINLGNPGNTLDEPVGVSLVREGPNFYAFNTNTVSGTITRTVWSNGLMGTPVAENLGNFSLLQPGIFGIQVKNYSGNWYAFVTNGNSLVRINLGNSLSADVQSAVTVVTSPLMDKARGLVIEQEGADWIGFCTNFPAKTITRFTWGPVLTSIPTVTDMTNIGGLTEPMQPALIRDATGWYMFVANTTSLSQLSFGNSLMNTPTGINLGNLGWMTDDRGMSLFMQCNNPYGLITNHNLVPNLILQLHFTGGLAGAKSITPLGSVANLYEPLALSETVNLGDTLFTVAMNATPSMTMLWFPPCTNSPLPSTTAFDPTPVVFTSPGTYTVKLTVDSGLPGEQTTCKLIYADATKPASLGSDTTICEGSSLTLDPGVYDTYLWNTGNTGRTLTVGTAGTYSVQVSNKHGCTSADTIKVNVESQINQSVDTAICFGERYHAGGGWQTVSGTYVDSTLTPAGCYKIVTTDLLVKPEIPLDLGADTCLTPGDTITLKAIVPGALSPTWQDGSHGTTFTVIKPGEYRATVVVDSCSVTDTIRIGTCPHKITFFFPTAFTPNGDGLNDQFLPKGTEVINYHLTVFDRWGRIVFESSDPLIGWNGILGDSRAPAGTYSYLATYADPFDPTYVEKATGTFTLVR